MTVRKWFPTLVYDAPLDAKPDEQFRKELLAECLQIREIDEEGLAWCAEHYPDGYTSYASMCRLHRMSPTFAELEQRLTRHVHSFARSLDFEDGGKNLAMTDCWVNVMPRHAAHGLHLHPTSTISGTYYVQTPKGSSALKLEDPRLAMFMGAPARKAEPKDANRTFVEYPAEAGKVILFESWLRHEVPPSRIEGERVSVSFNWNWY